MLIIITHDAGDDLAGFHRALMRDLNFGKCM